MSLIIIKLHFFFPNINILSFWTSIFVETLTDKENSGRTSKFYKAESTLPLLNWSLTQNIQTYSKLTALQRETRFATAKVQNTVTQFHTASQNAITTTAKFEYFSLFSI